MIRFEKKSDPQPAADDAGGESLKKVPEASADGQKKAANDRLFHVVRPTPHIEALSPWEVQDTSARRPTRVPHPHTAS